MSDWLDEQERDLAGNPLFELEKAVLEINRLIVDRMEVLNVKRADLARRMGVGRWTISRLLNNPANVELKTLVTAAAALGSRINFSLEPVAQGATRNLSRAVEGASASASAKMPIDPLGGYLHEATHVTNGNSRQLVFLDYFTGEDDAVYTPVGSQSVLSTTWEDLDSDRPAA